MKLLNSRTFIALAAGLASTAVAQTERDLDSHVHGLASLNVAIADSSVFIELNSPWNNLVGFEHAPESEQQHELVDQALQQLNDPEALFKFNDGDCSIVEVSVENSMSDDVHHDDHADEKHEDEHDDHAGEKHEDEHDDHADEKHEDEHDDHAGEKHEDEHDDHAEEKHGEEHDDHADAEHGDEHDDDHAEGSSTHSTVLAIYTYECKQLGKLSSIDVALFSVWSGFEDLDVQLIGDKGQTLLELSPGNSILSLEQVK